MTVAPLNSWVRAGLEFGPVLGFVVTYLILGNETFVIENTQYTGFVVVTAAFIPVFVIAIGVLWLISGKVSRVQIAAATLVIVFGGFSVWLNDPRLFKMKPTVIYLLLGLLLGIGLLRGQSWLKYIADTVIPMQPEGWMILTKRVMIVFFLSAGANELVWRTQSERFWVLFETLVMPVVILGFFLTQIGLFVDHVKLNKPRKKRRSKKPLS
jgi:intracellular septation protein